MSDSMGLKRGGDRVTRLIVAAGVVLLTAWSLVVPIFEAPDEPAHWQYAQYLHEHWGRGDWSLPYYEAGFEEANSPPLPYALVAPLAAPSRLPDMAMGTDVRGTPIPYIPPRLFYGSDLDLAAYRPVRLARLVIVLLGVASVWLSARAGHAATGRPETGWLTALIVLLLPQAAFRNATFSNDAAMLTAAAATTWGVVLIVRQGFTWRRGVAVSAALAIAYLSKINAIALLAPIAFAIASAPGSARQRIVRLSVLGVAAALVLPWSVYNVVRYGDPFASAAMSRVVAHIINERDLFSWYFLLHFPRYTLASFIGVFGWANLYLPLPLYAAYVAGGLAAVAGLVRGWIRGAVDRRLVVALGLAVIATLAIMVHINLRFTQPQGRYLFPALPALALLLVLGVEQLTARLPARGVTATLAALLLAGNLYALFGVVRPAYEPPAAHAVTADVRRLGLSWARDLHWELATRDFIISGPRPWLQVSMAQPASEVTEVTLLLRATLDPADRRGCLYFATDAAPLDANSPKCFTWRADGATQRVTLTMRGHPGWSGRLTHLRAIPFDDAAPTPGARFALEDWLTRK